MTSAVRCSMGLLLVGVVGVALQLNATTLYVDANNGNDDNDGLDWGRAAKTIQHAVYIAQSNDVIVVNDGIYESFITSNATIIIESVNGAEKTVVDGGGTKDQFNSVHDKLIETWRILKPYLKGEILHFSCVKDSLEDLTNVEYLRDCAIQAGINTKLIYVDDIGWNNVNFVDLEEEPITDIFKLYPWEWMVNELFAYNIKNDEIKANWIEPAWKMILSNKAILAVLWELYPNHHLLLETYIDNPKEMNDYVKKPLLSREGANVEIFKDGQLIEKSFGEYGEEGFIYQELAELHQEETGYSIIGSWIIGQESCGITIRESNQIITTDKSRFVPHIIE